MKSKFEVYTQSDPTAPLSAEALEGLRRLAEVLRRIRRQIEREGRWRTPTSDPQPTYEP